MRPRICIFVVLLLTLICLAAPAYATVMPWTTSARVSASSGTGGYLTVYYKAQNPVTGAWTSESSWTSSNFFYSWAVSGPYCNSGIVAWVVNKQTHPNGGSWGYSDHHQWDVYYYTYDPIAQQWKSGTWYLSAPFLESSTAEVNMTPQKVVIYEGVVFWTSETTTNYNAQTQQQFHARAYNPEAGSWNGGMDTSNAGLNTFISCGISGGTAAVVGANVAVCVKNTQGSFVTDPYYKTIYFGAYDNIWRIGTYSNGTANVSNLALSNGTVTWGSSSKAGYNHASTSWTTGTYTQPYARIKIGPTSSASQPFTVWAIDESIGGTSWDWDWGDDTYSTSHYPRYHTYNNSGLFPVTQTVNGQGPASTSPTTNVTIGTQTQITVDNKSGNQGQFIQITGRLLIQGTSTGISGKTISCTIDGSPLTPATKTTDGSGNVSWDYTIPAGALVGSQIPIVMTFAGDSSYAQSTGSGTITVTDTIAPYVSSINRLTPSGQTTNATSVVWRVTFSESVLYVDTLDFQITKISGIISGYSLSSVSASSGTTIDVTAATGTGDGEIRLDLKSKTDVQDAAGNTCPAYSSGQTYKIDKTAPTVTINQASGQADPTGTSPINFTAVFSETVTGFTSSDVTIGGTAGGTKTATVTGSGTTYTVAISGMTSSGTVTATIPAGVAQDGSGNNNTASTSTDNTVTYDITTPTVTINQAPGQADPTKNSPINFTAVFSESVTGFTNSDVTISGTAGGTKTATVTGSGTTYNVAISGMTSSGTVTATIPAGVAQDGSGYGNTASTSTDNSVTYDITAPTVTINQKSGQADPTKNSPINFTVVFSETVTGFTSSDVTIGGTAGGTKTATVTGSGTTYTVAISGMTSSGTVTATIPASKAQDAASNWNIASTSTDNSVTYDITAPTVTINQKSGQADPTGTSPINFTAVFSESVTGFTSSDVTIGGTAGGTKTATVTGSGTTYTVAISGMTSSGTVTATIPANKAQDAAGNTNAASTSTDNTVTYNNTGPTVTINQASGQADPTKNSPINFTVVFSASVTGFTNSDVTIGGTAGGTKTATVTGSGTTYTVAISGMTSSGMVTATIPAGVAQDGSGYGNTASTSTDNTVTYDITAPTVTINQASGQADPTGTSPINFTAVFSESVTGFTSSDVTIGGTAGGTKTATVTGSGTTYTIAISGITSSGTVTATIPAGVAQDVASNTNVASTSTDNSVTYNGVASPTVTINQASGQADPTNISPINFTAVFSESVTGFTSSDVTIGGTAGGTKTATVTGSGTTYTVAISGMTSSGTVAATIPAGVAQDGSGYSNTASTSTDNTVTWSAGSLGLEAVLLDMGSATYADVQAEAAREAAGNGPVYPSAPSYVPAYTTFLGYFTPAYDNTEMAVFSDDGVDVYVDGVRILNHINAPQPLPYLNQSLHVLPFDWQAGIQYSIGIQYSNIIYTGQYDIDGCTLFVYSGSGTPWPVTSITVDGGNCYPGHNHPLYVTLMNVSGVGLYGKTISYQVDGVNAGTATTGSGGRAWLSYPIPITWPIGSNHTVTATFAGDDLYNGSTGNGTITAAKLATSIRPSYSYGAPGKDLRLKTQLIEINGTPMSGKTISFSVEGSPVGTATTDASGYAYLIYNIPSTWTVGGTYIMSATYDGDGLYLGDSGSNNLYIVDKTPTHITIPELTGTFGQPLTIHATIRDNCDRLLSSGRNVWFYFLGLYIGSATTDDNSTATIIHVPGRVCSGSLVEAVWAGDAEYQGCDGIGNGTINPP